MSGLRGDAVPAALGAREAAGPARRSALRPLAARGALALLLAAALVIAAGAAAAPSTLTPSSRGGFPDWFAGPLAAASPGPLTPGAFGVVFLLMCAAYLAALALGDALPAWLALGAVAVLHGLFLLAPVLLTTDLFGYLAYARLGALEGLNPYEVGADALRGDPVHPFVVWHEDPSPYGPLFTVASYALAPLGVPAAVWTLKALAAGASLGVVALVHRAARHRGCDPVAAALFVGLNPIVLVYVVGGAHNDAFMVLAGLGALVLAHRGRGVGAGGALARGAARGAGAGAALAAALGVKAAALVLVPFVVLASRRRAAVLGGLLAGGAAVALLTLLVIGPGAVHLVAALGDQAAYVSTNSPQYLVSRLLGLESVSAGVRAGAAAILIGVLAWLVLRTLRGGDPVAAAGWGALATLATSVWLMPWYVLWVLPFAALARGRALRGAALLLCAAVVVTRIPLPLG